MPPTHDYKVQIGKGKKNAIMKNKYSNHRVRRIPGSPLMLNIVMSMVFIVGRQIGEPARRYTQRVGPEEEVRIVRERRGIEEPREVQ
jgi:ABC-type dipeptide/oligopeptide/nickel transport systems, permease components